MHISKYLFFGMFILINKIFCGTNTHETVPLLPEEECFKLKKTNSCPILLNHPYYLYLDNKKMMDAKNKILLLVDSYYKELIMLQKNVTSIQSKQLLETGSNIVLNGQFITAYCIQKSENEIMYRFIMYVVSTVKSKPQLYNVVIININKVMQYLQHSCRKRYICQIQNFFPLHEPNSRMLKDFLLFSHDYHVISNTKLHHINACKSYAYHDRYGVIISNVMKIMRDVNECRIPIRVKYQFYEIIPYFTLGKATSEIIHYIALRINKNNSGNFIYVILGSNDAMKTLSITKYDINNLLNSFAKKMKDNGLKAKFSRFDIMYNLTTAHEAHTRNNTQSN